MGDATRAALTATTRTICDVVGTALGPLGASKLVLTEQGEVATVASAEAILDRLDVEDPMVTLLADAAGSFADRYGDGTTSVVALTGALLDEAERLFEMGVHPTVVERGYGTAREVTLEYVDRHARSLSSVGPEAVARTALSGTRDPVTRNTVAEYVAEAVETVEVDGRGHGHSDGVAVATRIGPPSETELVDGLVLDYDPVTESMPRSVEGAGVAVLSSTVDTPTLAGETARSERSVSMAVESFEKRRSIREHERDVLHDRLDGAVEAGCRFLATGMSVNDRVKRPLANSGVVAIQRVDDADLRRLALATDAVVCPSLDHVTPETLGRADVRLRRLAGRRMFAVEDGAGEVAYTLLCRAPDPRSVESLERSAESALASTLRASREGTVVPGGGAVELGASRTLRDYARSIADREQLAVEAFADALTVVPRRLAATAGLPEWQTVTALLSAHAEGRDCRGIDVLAGEPVDVVDADPPVVDPTGLEREIVTAATELVVRILRIDDRIGASDLGTDDDTERDDAPAGDASPAERTPSD